MSKLCLNYEIRIFYQDGWQSRLASTLDNMVASWPDDEALEDKPDFPDRHLFCYCFPRLPPRRKYPIIGFDLRTLSLDAEGWHTASKDELENVDEGLLWTLIRGRVTDSHKIMIRSLVEDLVRREAIECVLLDYLEDSFMPGVIEWLRGK